MERENNIIDIDAVMDARFGATGSESRCEFRQEAHNYCVGQLITDARKQKHMTQSDLASKIGANKSYISRVEKGQIEPGVGTFFRIIEALGLRFEIVRPMAYSYASLSSPTYLSDSKPDLDMIYAKKSKSSKLKSAVTLSKE